MYNEREEILDMAMDILDNTDATLEEAMGVALESQMRKMKAEARKTGDWDKVIVRQGLKDYGKRDTAAYAGINPIGTRRRDRILQTSNLNYKYQDDKRPPVKKITERFPGEAKTRQYQERTTADQRKFDKNAKLYHDYIDKEDQYRFSRDRDYLNSKRRMENMGDYSKSVPANNGRGTQYRPKASKEAAIMDTALDYMDMYDVSMETAIDMAYEDYED